MLSASIAPERPTTPPTTQNVLPKTPERGRARTRYPSHLSRQVDSEGKPRPLLHRRGTSRIYETLEDLLKEAGYKETRIFTPEMERREAEREQRKETESGHGNKTDNTGGVGGAVVKLFSTWISKRVGSDREAGDSRRVPYPPSPLAHRSKTPLSSASTLRMPSPSRSSSSSVVTVRPSHDLHPDLAFQHQHSLSRQSLRPEFESSSSTFTSSYHPPSRARLALRHVASAPHIDKRRVRTQPRSSRANKSKVPPLPATWLESISAALRSPRLTSLTSPTTSNTAFRKPTVISHRPPTSVVVTITNVVCRSAPSSRSSSAVRSPSNKARVPVPTLAQTCVCEELMSTVWPPHSPHHLPHGISPSPMDDDEDDELNLTMMLIPSKRQHSIRSLRSVLQHHDTLPGSTANVRDEYARVMRRRIEEAENENEAGARGQDGEGHWDSGEFLTARIKRRRSGLPRQWGWTS